MTGRSTVRAGSAATRAGAPASAEAADPPSVLLRDVRIGSRGPVAHLRIERGWVTAIGEWAAQEPVDEVVEAAGRTVLPGLWDAHVHAVQWASARRRIDVSAATSARAAVALVADDLSARHIPPAEMAFAYGFRDGLWTERPHKDLLEVAVPGRPVVVVSNDLHTAWLSHAALSLVGRSDHETGVLVESEALQLMAQLPQAGEDETDRWVQEALTAAASRGVTGILDFEVGDNLRDWTRRHAREPLPLRVTCAIYPLHLDAAVAAGLRSGMPLPGSDGFIEVGPLKIFVDGSLNTRTALCHDPYPGAANQPSYGALVTEPEELEALMRRAAGHGLSPAVHAIGDRANTIALDAFERVGCRGRIEHAQLLTAEDVPRFAPLAVIAGVQPAHTDGDRDIADRLWAGRTARAFCYADLLAAGATLELGSDAPVAPLDPWHGIAAAVARTDGERPAWHPEQSIPLADALAAASRGRRSVRVGDAADLVMVEGDPAGMTPSQLREMPVSGTLMGGRWTFRA